MIVSPAFYVHQRDAKKSGGQKPLRFLPSAFHVDGPLHKLAVSRVHVAHDLIGLYHVGRLIIGAVLNTRDNDMTPNYLADV